MQHSTPPSSWLQIRHPSRVFHRTCSSATPKRAFLAASLGALHTALSADASAAVAAMPDTAASLEESRCAAVLRCAAGLLLCGSQLLLWQELAAGCKLLLAPSAGADCLQKNNRKMQFGLLPATAAGCVSRLRALQCSTCIGHAR
jgi:hypothetical protein